jgi:hypothetical protein
MQLPVEGMGSIKVTIGKTALEAAIEPHTYRLPSEWSRAKSGEITL